MDNELIERARELAGNDYSDQGNGELRELVPALCDALEAAQAENARLREALEEIKRIHAQTWRYDTPIKTIEVLDKMVNIAYAALEPRP